LFFRFSDGTRVDKSPVTPGLPHVSRDQTNRQNNLDKYREGHMADEKNKDQNQDSERNEKAMGATATGAQGQPGGQQNTGRTPQESPGQGGGIQGTGQRNPAQGQDKGDQAGDRGEDFKPTGGGARQGDGDV
jgi:hypothetical protein